MERFMTTTMTEATVCPKQAALEKLTEVVHGHPSGKLNRWGGSVYSRNLLFSESAKVRLASICGFLEGLRVSDPERAAELAYDLDRQLTWLSGYGGDSETFHQEGWNPLPRFKVMLWDDGCWGSFSIQWFRIIPLKDIHKHAFESMPEWYRDGTRPEGMTEEKVDELHREATKAAFAHFKVRLDERKSYIAHDDRMEETRYRPEEYADQPYYCRAETFVYGYSFNGGLIYHYPKDDLTQGSWSIHT